MKENYYQCERWVVEIVWSTKWRGKKVAILFWNNNFPVVETLIRLKLLEKNDKTLFNTSSFHIFHSARINMVLTVNLQKNYQLIWNLNISFSFFLLLSSDLFENKIIRIFSSWWKKKNRKSNLICNPYKHQ